MTSERIWPPVYRGTDARVELPGALRGSGQRAHLVAGSPPYWAKRRYCDDPAHDEWGAGSLDRYVSDCVDFARNAWHIMRPWSWLVVNLGDTRTGSGGAGGDAKAAGQRVYRQGGSHLDGAQEAGVPWRVAIAIQERTRFRLQSAVTWSKGRPVRTDSSLHHMTRNRRPGHSSEMLFLFVRPGRVDGQPWWDPTYLNSIGERGDVWSIPASTVRPPWASPSDEVPPWPDELVKRLVLSLCPPSGRVVDPFCGYGTTQRVAVEHGRDGIGFDLFNFTHEWPQGSE